MDLSSLEQETYDYIIFLINKIGEVKSNEALKIRLIDAVDELIEMLVYK